MPIKKFELLHGAVLTRLTRNNLPMKLQLIKIGPDKESWATYIINHKLAILIKSSTSPTQGKNNARRWNFTFQPNQLEELKKLNEQHQVHVALVCGADNLKTQKTEICLIKPAQLTELIKLDASPQQISIDLQDRQQLNVTGCLSGINYPIKVPRNGVDQLVVPGS
jgi:hypothetical protein